MPNLPDYYAVLGLMPSSEDVVVQAAYRALMRRYHPDRGGPAADAARAQAINEAYSVLGDPARRADYDGLRAHQAHIARFSGAHPHLRPHPPSAPPRSYGGSPRTGPGENDFRSGGRRPATATTMKAPQRIGLGWHALPIWLLGFLAAYGSMSGPTYGNISLVEEDVTRALGTSLVPLLAAVVTFQLSYRLKVEERRFCAWAAALLMVAAIVFIASETGL
jgi:hypothetical protein